MNGTEDMKPEHMSVIVENGRIVEILPADGLLPSDCEIVNIKGLYLMPGLINLHVHLNSGGKPSGKKKQPEDYVRLVKVATSNALTGEIVRSMSRGYAYMELQSGVTTIRTVGGISDYDGKIRNEIEEGVRLREKFTEDRLPGMKKHNLRSSLRAVRTGFTRIPAGPFAPDGVGAAIRGGAAGSAMPGPRILTANMGISVPGGIMDAETEGAPGVLKMSPEIIKAACEEAHKLGLSVAAHTESTQGVIEALRGGVDTIEHGALPTDEMMELFHQKGASLVTTISPIMPMALLDTAQTHVRPMDRRNAGIVLRGVIECARRALREGIPVGLGTDSGCPFVTQYDMWRELQYFHNFCGVSEAEALYTATLGNAKIAGLGEETGSIEPGKAADFLITAGNPLENLRALRRPRMIVARGVQITNPILKKDVEIEQALDDLLRYTYEDLDDILAGE